ncbi:kinesin-related protein 4-like [Anastrepha obliqua]|uniref:kinesin-related protein 4-like n=1 Tax=Anastrepha obliqua TaxID=95512 RepID=UPI00240A30DF|nr:kinesin-related protein 4-like [Anastrepha obliqua]
MAGPYKRVRLGDCDYEETLSKWNNEDTDSGTDIDDVSDDYNIESEHDTNSELSEYEEDNDSDEVDSTERPGSNLELKFEKDVHPINKLDEPAKEHDVAYSKSNDIKKRHEAHKILEDKEWSRVLAKDASLSEKVLFNIIMNEEQIRLLLEEENSTSDYKNENDSDVEDFVARDVESYDTEQEDDEEYDEELNEIDDREFYLDAKMFYASKMEVYVGKQPSGPYEVDNSSMELVVRLSESIHNSGRNITCDNFFTSIPLLDKLESKHKLTIIGTIRKNKKELHKQFTEIRGRAEKSSLFGHRGNCSLVSYVSKKGENVLLVSSMHAGVEINEITNKPEMIMDYNMTKGEVDTVDKMCDVEL